MKSYNRPQNRPVADDSAMSDDTLVTPKGVGDSKEKQIDLSELAERLHSYAQRYEVQRELRNGQLGAFTAVADALGAGVRCGTIVMPTGAGKTVIFARIADALEVATLIVTATRDAVDQTVKRFKEHAPKKAIGRYSTDAKELDVSSVVTTYNSFLTLLSEGKITPERFPLIIFDEAHYAQGEQRQDAILKKELLNKHVVLGFTATPDYNTGRRVSDLIGPEIYRMGIREAIDLELLCGFRNVIAETTIDISGVDLQGGDFNLEQLSSTLERKKALPEAARVSEELMRGRKSIAFCGTIDFAEKYLHELEKFGVKGALITGEDSIEKRAELKRQLADGEIAVLACADVLSHAVDIPEVDCVLLVTPTLSTHKVTQRGGRGLRYLPGNPNKNALIINFLYTCDRARDVVTFSDTVDGTVQYGKKPSTPDNSEENAPSKTVGSITVHTVPTTITRELEKRRLNKISPAPEKWQNALQLGARYGVTPQTIRRVIDDVRETHAADINEHIHTGRLVEFYGPAVQTIIARTFDPLHLEPELPANLTRRELEDRSARSSKMRWYFKEVRNLIGALRHTPVFSDLLTYNPDLNLSKRYDYSCTHALAALKQYIESGAGIDLTRDADYSPCSYTKDSLCAKVKELVQVQEEIFTENQPLLEEWARRWAAAIEKQDDAIRDFTVEALGNFYLNWHEINKLSSPAVLVAKTFPALTAHEGESYKTEHLTHVEQVDEEDSDWPSPKWLQVADTIEGATPIADIEAASAAVHRAIERLPDAQRQALTLCFFKGMNPEEFEIQTGLSRNNFDLGIRTLRQAASLQPLLRAAEIYDNRSPVPSNPMNILSDNVRSIATPRIIANLIADRLLRGEVNSIVDVLIDNKLSHPIKEARLMELTNNAHEREFIEGIVTAVHTINFSATEATISGAIINCCIKDYVQLSQRSWSRNTDKLQIKLLKTARSLMLNGSTIDESLARCRKMALLLSSSVMQDQDDRQQFHNFTVGYLQTGIILYCASRR